MNKFCLVFFVLFLFVASAVAQKSDIRKIDFQNFTYEMSDLSGEGKMTVTVKDGKFLREDVDDRLYFEVTNVAYGDLNADGINEAIVTTIFNSGGTGNFSNGFVFTMDKNKPVVLTEFEGGDRADGGLVSAKVVGGLLVVERNSAGEFGGACCPEFVETTRYKLNGATLAEVGKTESRELYQAARIAFTKGTSMSKFAVKIPNGEIKRYVVGAKKGQRLVVSTNVKPAADVSYRLVRGDGVEEQSADGIIVKLNQNGDYVFELSNSSEKDLNILVKVEIN